jgi:tRNA splicing endonuclease
MNSKNSNKIFNKLRERVSWYAHVDPQNGKIKLTLVCLPVDWGNNKTKKSVSFSPNRVNEFVDQLAELCASQVKFIRNSIASIKFNELLASQKDFLTRATITRLAYDRDHALRLNVEDTATRRDYVIAQNKIVADQLLKEIFVDNLNQNKNTLSEGDQTRATALEVTTNIPLNMVSSFVNKYNAYKLLRIKHLYTQEQNAKNYEKLIKEYDWDMKDVILSTLTTFSLTDQRLVRMFFRGLIIGLIKQETIQERLKRMDRWVIVPFDDQQRVLLADSADENGIWDALRFFTLIMPNQPPDRNNTDVPYDREKYYQLFEHKISVYKETKDAIQNRKEIEGELLKELERNANNIRLLEMAYLLRVGIKNFWETDQLNY